MQVTQKTTKRELQSRLLELELENAKLKLMAMTDRCQIQALVQGYLNLYYPSGIEDYPCQYRVLIGNTLENPDVIVAEIAKNKGMAAIGTYYGFKYVNLDGQKEEFTVASLLMWFMDMIRKAEKEL